MAEKKHGEIFSRSLFEILLLRRLSRFTQYLLLTKP